MRKITTAKRKKPQMFLIVGVDLNNHVHNIMDRSEDEAEAVQRAGQLAVQYDTHRGYSSIAVYELKGVAKRPEVPVNFVTIQSLEVDNGPSR